MNLSRTILAEEPTASLVLSSSSISALACRARDQNFVLEDLGPLGELALLLAHLGRDLVLDGDRVADLGRCCRDSAGTKSAAASIDGERKFGPCGHLYLPGNKGLFEPSCLQSLLPRVRKAL